MASFQVSKITSFVHYEDLNSYCTECVRTQLLIQSRVHKQTNKRTRNHTLTHTRLAKPTEITDRSVVIT